MSTRAKQAVALGARFPWAVNDALRKHLSKPEVIGKLHAERLARGQRAFPATDYTQAIEPLTVAIQEALGDFGNSHAEVSVFWRDAVAQLARDAAQNGTEELSRYLVVMTLEKVDPDPGLNG